MKILNLKKYPRKELLKRLRQVTLLHSSRTKNLVYIYKTAKIELIDLPVSILMPEQFYQIESVLRKLQDLQKALQEKNIDIFNLNGYVSSYVTNKSKKIHTLLPVVV